MTFPQETEQPDCVAVIGMAGRFPGAPDTEQLWRNLCAGKDAVTRFTDDQLLSAGEEPSLLQAPNYVKAGVLLEDMDAFDAEFFGITPREAEMTDPQHRIFLECAWEALENAGHDPDTTPLRIGVFAGTGTNNYFAYSLASNPGIMKSWNDFQRMIAIDNDYLTTRVSYKLNLRGPSIAIQTACSTSLVSVHLACQSLLSGECDMALAGGVFIKIPHIAGYLWEQGSILSPEGECRAFDAAAKGTVFGSGAGIVVLKRLSDALADGDCIRALIKGSSINNDGSSKIGYTAPSVDGQAAVIAEAQAIAGVTADEITYIEAHGTGTPLGDPIEIAALTKAFRRTTQKKNFCAIGSLKTNIGHLDTAAGIAGLIKAVLALQHKAIPASLHFEQPNPEIDFANSPFYVNTKLQAWNAGPTPRRAGVSSFGFGGTNAHVIAEEAPELRSQRSDRPSRLILLSARTHGALEKTTKNLSHYLEQQPHTNIDDLTYTLQVGRKRFKHRRMLVCDGREDALQLLTAEDNKRILTNSDGQIDPPLVFMFTGQGSQCVNMALGLYQVEGVFRDEVDRLCELFEPLLQLDLRKAIFPPSERAAEAAQELTQTRITQPALFVIEYALARLWMAWGVVPHSMIGHSIGEYVAACLAGVFSVEDVVALIAERGRLMQSLPAGSMLAVPMAVKELLPLVTAQICLAASNGPRSCVLSGPSPEIKALEARLTEEGRTCVPLRASHAFHSAMMNPILETFVERVASVKRNPPRIPFISNLTGTWITDADATDPQYWAKHLRHTVLFAEGIKTLLNEASCILLEIGPGNTLCSLAKKQLQSPAKQIAISSLPRPEKQQSDFSSVLTALGQLWISGITVNWSGVYALEHRHRIPLPTYPFERQRFWLSQQKRNIEEPDRPAHALVRQDISDWFHVPLWKQSVQVGTVADRSALRPRKYVFFLDEYGLGIRLAERMKRRGHRLITVLPGDSFRRIRDDCFALAPGAREDYDALFTELRVSGNLPDAVVHLGSVGAEREPNISLAAAQESGFYSVLFLAQALGTHPMNSKLDIAVVTSSLHNVTGDENIHPEQASVVGLSRVIPQEYPGIGCRNIDVVLPQTDGRMDRLLELLEQEVEASSHDPIVCYRHNRRWTQSFEPLRLNSTPGINEPQLLRIEGVYLITGGLGNIGLTFAAWLARAYKARLVLTSRTVFPARETWDQWLRSHNSQDPTSKKIRSITAIEASGGQVLVVRGDVSNQAEMQMAIDKVSAHFGAINAVIHAAGFASSQMIRDLSRADCEAYFAAKIRGLYCLEKVLKGKPIDFCLLTSSLSSVLGGLGFGAYAAANAFMDAFASKQNETSTFPWICIDWDRWRPEDGEESQRAANSALMRFSLTASEGMEAFKRILSAGSLNHVIVSTGDLQERIRQWVSVDIGSKWDETENGSVVPAVVSAVSVETNAPGRERNGENATKLYPRPALSSPYIEPDDSLELAIANIWQRLLGIDRIGTHDNFFELGGDSLMAIQAVTLMNKGFSGSLRVVTFYESPTIKLLAEKLAKPSDEATADLSKDQERAVSRKDFAGRRARSRSARTELEEGLE